MTSTRAGFYRHRETPAHVALKQAFEAEHDSWHSVYGRTPVSAMLEQDLFKNHHEKPEVKACLNFPFTFGVRGCEDNHDTAEVSWLKTMSKFDLKAEFKIVTFGLSVGDIINRLPLLTRGLLHGNTIDKFEVPTMTPALLVISNGYADSDFFKATCKTVPAAIVSASDASIERTLSNHLKSRTLDYVGVILDPMMYQTLSFFPKDTYGRVRKWCESNNIPFIADETLSFLMRGPSAFAYMNFPDFKRPDFILIGKFTSLSALLSTSSAIDLTGARASPVTSATKRQDTFQRYLWWVGTIRTHRYEALTLMRSSVVLGWALESNLCQRMQEMETGVPETFSFFGLPTPSGGGFIWYFDDDALQKLDETSLGKEIIKEKLAVCQNVFTFGPDASSFQELDAGASYVGISKGLSVTCCY